MSEMRNVLAIANEVKEKNANFLISEVNDHSLYAPRCVYRRI